MDSPKKPPIVFANRVLRMLVDHLVDEKMIIQPNDYASMRVVFRKAKGSWQRLQAGDILMASLLAQIVTSWGAMPGREKETETW